MPLYVGTSGWAYPTWKPAFYPEKLAQKKFLNFYATRLNTVEVNFTFRQLVKESTIQNWLSETPDHFRFTIKDSILLAAVGVVAMLYPPTSSPAAYQSFRRSKLDRIRSVSF